MIQSISHRQDSNANIIISASTNSNLQPFTSLQSHQKYPIGRTKSKLYIKMASVNSPNSSFVSPKKEKITVLCKHSL